MKARIPKAYRDLTPKAKEQLQNYIVEIATEAAKKQEYLNKRMSEIFKKNGFPQEFMDSLLGEIVIVDAPQEEG